MIFTYNNRKGGVFCPKYHLAPWPGFIFRRQAILDMAKKIPVGNYIEIGMGAGVLTYDFYRLGFSTSGYDLSADAVKIADDIFNGDKHRIDFKDTLNDSDMGRFDCFGMYEVLEHIEDDAGALRQYAELLKPHGYVVISVPARMKYWGSLDVRSGHIRRYEKKDLVRLLEDNGFRVEDIINYGFPFTNLMRKLFSTVLHQKESDKLKAFSDQDRTLISGINRSPEYRFRKWIPYRILVFLSKVQRIFYHRVDLGQGYIAIAQRKNP